MLVGSPRSPIVCRGGNMPRFVITATVSCPRIVASQIPRKLALELEKPRYRRWGVVLETCDMEEVKEWPTQKK